MSTRLNKWLAHAGVASRRTADEMIGHGRVRINEEPATVGSRVEDGDVVEVDGIAVSSVTDTVILAIFKPRGVMSTLSDPHAEKTVADMVPEQYGRLNPVGRLDKETDGLLLMTNDGDLHHRLTHPSFQHEKEYHVFLNSTINDGQLERLANGIELEEGSTGAADVTRLNETSFSIVLRQGWNRQIRRMVESVGYTVDTLTRVRIEKLELHEGVLREISPENPIVVTRADIFGDSVE